jgi:hypothetical protein
MKLHLGINVNGEILSFCLTSGNVSAINKDVIERLTKNIFGTLVGDKGYISNKIFEKHITMITKICSNMKNRAVIEFIKNILKGNLQIKQTRHRSLINFLVNLVSGIVAYSLYDSKLTIFT